MAGPKKVFEDGAALGGFEAGRKQCIRRFGSEKLRAGEGSAPGREGKEGQESQAQGMVTSVLAKTGASSSEAGAKD